MSTRLITYIGWGVLLAAAVTTQAIGATSNRVATVGQLIRRLTARATLRAIALVGWLWVGWHFFVRSSR